MKSFKCHCCEEVIEGKPDIRVSMFLGFAWNTEEPNQYMDFCQECAFTFLKKFRECRNERLADVYQKQLEAWTIEKLENIKKERSKGQCQDHLQPLAGFSINNAHPANAKKPLERTFARIVTHKGGQMEHIFSVIKSRQNP